MKCPEYSDSQIYTQIYVQTQHVLKKRIDIELDLLKDKMLQEVETVNNWYQHELAKLDSARQEQLTVINSTYERRLKAKVNQQSCTEWFLSWF